MRTDSDLSPLFRSTIGFDRMSRLLDAATRVDESALSYPPYNIESASARTPTASPMAVAGFAERHRHHRPGELARHHRQARQDG